MGDTGDLVHVERVETKFKRTKLNMYIPPIRLKSPTSTTAHILAIAISLAIASHLAKAMNLAIAKNLVIVMNLVIAMSLANAINLAKIKILANSNTTHRVRETPHPESQPLEL